MTDFSNRSIQISAHKLSKRYRLGPPLGTIFPGLFNTSYVEALKDINFDIKSGERLGIVGRNGSGKSTLLKLLCGCSAPSSGSVRINGSVGAILELGTGFSPSSSVLDNAKMGLICQGVPNSSLDTLLEFVLSFSELSDLEERQFSTLSSGMQARLMISTALARTPDVLIVDEALATGDALFQAKCLDRVRDICDVGTTVVFVTHSISLLYQFCTRGILLNKGILVLDGPPQDVGRQYEKLLSEDSKKTENPQFTGDSLINTSSSVDSGLVPDSEVFNSDTSDFGISILPKSQVDAVHAESIIQSFSSETTSEASINLLDGNELKTNMMVLGEKYFIDIHFSVDLPYPSLDIGYRFCTPAGQPLTGDTLHCHQLLASVEPGSYSVRFSFTSNLSPGEYLLDCAVVLTEPKSSMFRQLVFVRMPSPVLSSSTRITNGIVLNFSSMFEYASRLD